MVNDCIRIGLGENISSLKALSIKSYHSLKGYNIPSYYKLCAISRASGILQARKKSIRRGIPTKSPYAVKNTLTSCYGFKVKDGALMIPLGHRRFLEIQLNRYTQNIISDKALKIRSFTLTDSIVSICISKEVEESECISVAGVDRNLWNVTYGCHQEGFFTQYDLSKAVRIAETTREIVASFKRKDARIRKKIASKYGLRRRNRVRQLIHDITKSIVETAYKRTEGIAIEDICGIRKLYCRGNFQGNIYRGMMNDWPFFEVKRQIEYKANWLGVKVIHLTKGETRGTSTQCPRCGEGLQFGRDRMSWCPSCKMWRDRDIVGALNISRKGWLRFDHSSKGGAGEAMRRNPTTTVIPGADVPKLSPVALRST